MVSRYSAWFVAAVLLASACTSSDSDGSAGGLSPQEPSAGDAWLRTACELPASYVTRIRRGYFPGRSPDLMVVPKEPNFFAPTTHSGPWPYLQEVPLVLYGPGFIRAQGEVSLEREVTVADLAPTFAELLGTPFPEDRPGRPLTEALVPEDQRNGRPRLILTVVWDGGGWNVLDTWSESWPHLADLIDKGTSIAGATVGSSPSVTPAVHATIGTGAFPDSHGIVDIRMRVGGRITDSWAGDAPTYLEIPTLADLYDQRTGNRAEVGLFAFEAWHLGMIGYGAALPGGDKDVAVVTTGTTTTKLATNSKFYRLPSYLHDVGGFEQDVHTTDVEDGQLDSMWLDNDVLDDPLDLKLTPAWILYQTRLIKAMLRAEGFGRDEITDLFYTNYKPIDRAGHVFRIAGEEIGELVRYSDEALAELISFLNAEIGPNNWVLAVTADHGQAPDLETTGAWPIRAVELLDNIGSRFGVEREELVTKDRPVGFWLDAQTLATNDIATSELADQFIDYRLEDNLLPDESLPELYEGRSSERLFDAAFPSDRLPQISQCVQSNRR